LGFKPQAIEKCISFFIAVPEPVEGHFSFLQVILPKRFEQSVQNEKADEKPAIKNNIANYMNLVKYRKFKF